VARRGWAGQAWRGKAWRGKAGRGKAWQTRAGIANQSTKLYHNKGGTMTKANRIRDHLKHWRCTAREIRIFAETSPGYVRKILSDLRREGSLKQELTDGGRPLRYWLEAK